MDEPVTGPGRGRRRSGAGGASIQDVARAVGVSPSTVSRALTMPGRIGEETRRRVLEAASRLGYTANAAARNLRVGRSRAVMIVMPGPLNVGASQVIAELLTVIDSELVVLGYSLLIANIDRRPEAERFVFELAFGGMTDGAIVFSSDIPAIDGRSLTDAGMPIVSGLFDLSGQGIASVVTNDHEASGDVIRHLAAVGHRDFLYVGGPEGNYNEVERQRGVREALDDVPECSLVYQRGDFSFESGVAAAETYLRSERRPTAVFCASDDMALAFIRRLADAGIKTPSDISVVGFDGSSVTSYTVPSLSSVHQPTKHMAREMVRLLIDLMENRPVDAMRVVVPSTLKLKESTSSPPGLAGTTRAS